VAVAAAATAVGAALEGLEVAVMVTAAEAAWVWEEAEDRGWAAAGVLDWEEAV
jgi:hypothetical protein